MGSYIQQVINHVADDPVSIWVPVEEYPLPLSATVGVKLHHDLWLVSRKFTEARMALYSVPSYIEAREKAMGSSYFWVLYSPDLDVYRATSVDEGVPDGWVVVSEPALRGVAQATAYALDMEAAQGKQTWRGGKEHTLDAS